MPATLRRRRYRLHGIARGRSELRCRRWHVRTYQWECVTAIILHEGAHCLVQIFISWILCDNFIQNGARCRVATRSRWKKTVGDVIGERRCRHVFPKTIEKYMHMSAELSNGRSSPVEGKMVSSVPHLDSWRQRPTNGISFATLLDNTERT